MTFKPRLKNARRELLIEPLNLDRVLAAHREWYTYNEYLVLQRIDEDVSSLKHTSEYLALLASKRGNSVYAYRVEKRMKSKLGGYSTKVVYSGDSGKRTGRILFGDLTYDTKKCSIIEAWMNIGIELNKCRSFLIKKYGKFDILRVWESSEKGYPHIHFIMIFRDRDFSAFYYNGKWRIDEKDEFAKCWHSHVDVELVVNLNEVLFYIWKYCIKACNPNSFERKAKLTSALSWLFRKRIYGLSKNFNAVDLTCTKHNSNPESDIGNRAYCKNLQYDLSGKPASYTFYRFIGIFTAVEIDVKEILWKIPLTEKQIKEIWHIIKEHRLGWFSMTYRFNEQSRKMILLHKQLQPIWS